MEAPDSQAQGKPRRRRRRGRGQNNDKTNNQSAPLPTSQPLLQPATPSLINTRLMQLMRNAAAYLQQNAASFTLSQYFYRDKSQEYFHHILRDRGGWMETYRKDHHGDPLSPINGRLDGLFFSVNMDKKTGKLPRRSIYGEMRLVVPARAMLARYSNLYFTDFYCIARSVHYVTLVMTKPGTLSDEFCRRNLIQLDWETNAFLRVVHLPSANHNGWNHTLLVTSGVWVEILYTEHLLIPELFIAGAQFLGADMQGHRSGGRQGIPKNAKCLICNV